MRDLPPTARGTDADVRSPLTARRTATCVILAVAMSASMLGLSPPAGAKSPALQLKSGTFVPKTGIARGFPAVARARRHGILALDHIPSRRQRTTLAKAGVKLFGYIPDRAFLASFPADVRRVAKIGFVRSIVALRPTDKIAGRPSPQAPGAYPQDGDDGNLRLAVQFFDDVSVADAAATIRARRGKVTELLPDFHLIEASLPPAELQALLAEDRVQWVDPVVPGEPTNDGARLTTNVEALQTVPFLLSGFKVTIGQWDVGHAITPSGVLRHNDFQGRIVRGDTTGPAGVTSNEMHATHVAGTLLGDGNLSLSKGFTPQQLRGMAPQAKLVAYDSGSFLSEYSGAIGSHKIDLSTNSWKSTASGSYIAQSMALDQIVRGSYGGKRIPIHWAAGNQRKPNGAPSACLQDLDEDPLTRFDSYGCIVDLAAAKDTLTVGATNSNDDSMTDFSSWGPTLDGRLKPEVVAPGCESGGDQAITSTLPGDVYGKGCGTSMSTPVVAGSTALLIQQRRKQCSTTASLWPSTIKALFVHTARDLDDATPWYNRGPDYASGYGRIDTKQAVGMLPFYRESTVSQGATKTFAVTAAAQKNLKVTVGWDDKEGTTNAFKALINDLDLWVEDPNGVVTRPWRLVPANPQAPATRAIDTRNVVEQVVVDNAMAGTWKFHVRGSNVPAGPQDFSIVTELLTPQPCGGAGGYDAWQKDDANDTGGEPYNIAVQWHSPDIRVRHADADGPVGENPEIGNTNHIFVTVRNRGAQTLPYARVYVYRTALSTVGAWPSTWEQIGSTTVFNVPGNGGFRVSDSMPWRPTGTAFGGDKVCFGYRIVTPNDPTGPETMNFGLNVANANAIGWDNRRFVDNLIDEPLSSDFLMRNGGNEPGTFDLRFREAGVPHGDRLVANGKVVVDLSALADRIGRGGASIRGMTALGRSRYSIVADDAVVRGIRLKGLQSERIGITISVRNGKRGRAHRFDVIQSRAGARPGRTDGGVSFDITE